MVSRRGINIALLILVVYLSKFSFALLSCPAGCSCENVNVICDGTSWFPNLTFNSNNFSAFKFLNCQFANDILPTIPQSYSNVTDLSFVNCIKAIGLNAFEFLEKLECLTITGSKSLKFMSSKPFETLKSLRFLDLSNNELLELPASICEHAEFLSVVNISHNRLNDIPVGTFERCFSSLEVIEIQNNNFSTLSYHCLPWFHLYSLNMSGNPWNCDCAMQWVKDISKSLFTGARCSFPEKSAGKELYEVENAIHCGLGDKSIALGIGIPILIVCLIVMGYCAYRIVHRNRKRIRSSVKYSTVYGDTVESTTRSRL